MNEKKRIKKIMRTLKKRRKKKNSKITRATTERFDNQHTIGEYSISDLIAAEVLFDYINAYAEENDIMPGDYFKLDYTEAYFKSGADYLPFVGYGAVKDILSKYNITYNGFSDTNIKVKYLPAIQGMGYCSSHPVARGFRDNEAMGLSIHYERGVITYSIKMSIFNVFFNRKVLRFFMKLRRQLVDYTT